MDLGPVNVVSIRKNLIEDPTRYQTPGETARTARALLEIANHLNAEAKNAAKSRMVNGKFVDGNVTFTEQDDQERISIDSKEVREILPPGEYPEIYKTSKVRGHIRVTFKKENA